LVVSQTAAEVVMPTFKVELAQTVIERATVYVEASDEDAAEKLALEESIIGYAEFRFCESASDIEVIGVEELKP
jgi:hypothetical protein